MNNLGLQVRSANAGVGAYGILEPSCWLARQVWTWSDVPATLA